MVIALDCEGVLINSMPALINLGIECVRKYFNIEIAKERVEEMVLRFSGGTFGEGFSKVLEFFVPGYDKEKFKQCYRELLEKRTTIYEEVEPFPEVIEVIKQLSKNFHLVISSGLERVYIEGFLKRIGVMNLFEVIYGGDDGKKEKHIQMFRHKYPGEEMVIVGDSLYEMGLGVKSIGVARKTWQAQLLKEAGASAIISSLDQLKDQLDQLL